MASSLEASHKMPGTIISAHKTDQTSDLEPSDNLTGASAAAGGHSSAEETLLEAGGGFSSGLDSEGEGVYASWDRLLHDGGHGSSPVSAVAIVQVHPHQTWCMTTCTHLCGIVEVLHACRAQASWYSPPQQMRELHTNKHSHHRCDMQTYANLCKLVLCMARHLQKLQACSRNGDNG